MGVQGLPWSPSGDRGCNDAVRRIVALCKSTIGCFVQILTDFHKTARGAAAPLAANRNRNDRKEDPPWLQRSHL